jgi:hypothetical protein
MGGGGLDSFRKGQGQWQGVVNTVTNLRVPKHVRNFWRPEELLAFLGLGFMEFSSRTFSFLLFCKVRDHVSYQFKTKDKRLLLKCFTASVSCKDLERAQPDLYRIQTDPNSNHCGGTPNVAVKCLANCFEFMNVHFKSRPADPLYYSPIPFTFFPTCHSLITLPFYATQSEAMTASLNK